MIILDMRDRLAHELTAAVVTLRLGSSQLEFGMQVRQLTSSPHRGGTVAGGELQGPHSLLFLIVSLALKLQCSPWPRVNFVFLPKFSQPALELTPVPVCRPLLWFPEYLIMVLLCCWGAPGSHWFALPPLLTSAIQLTSVCACTYEQGLCLGTALSCGTSWSQGCVSRCSPPPPEDPCSHPQGVGMTLVPLPHQWAPWGQDERCASCLCI